MFTCIGAIGHTKVKFEIKTFQELIFEVMPLDHSESVHCFVPHCKLHTAVIIIQTPSEATPPILLK